MWCPRPPANNANNLTLGAALPLFSTGALACRKACSANIRANPLTFVVRLLAKLGGVQ